MNHIGMVPYKCYRLTYGTFIYDVVFIKMKPRRPNRERIMATCMLIKRSDKGLAIKDDNPYGEIDDYGIGDMVIEEIEDNIDAIRFAKLTQL